MHVLHIEDRRENRLLVRKLLEAKGHRVTDAADGLTGIELALTRSPDLVLVDINIPGMDGYEVVTRLKGHPAMADTPVVAITAEGDRSRALSLGFDGFIIKPIRMAGFEQQIVAFWEGARELVNEEERTSHLMDHTRRVAERLEAKVRELTRANERLREVDQLKMEVLRNVSHELATPMTPLLGYVKLLGEIGPLNVGQQKIQGSMSHSLMRLRGLIDNLLNVTRFATGNVALELGVVDAADIARQAAEAVAARCARRNMRINLRIDPRLEPVVADRARLGEALGAVLDNAVKFGPDEQLIVFAVRLLVQGDGDQRLVEWAVSDAGPGIPAEERERVSEPFYQVDGSITRRVGGAGLGLAVASRVAELHQGRLVITGGAAGGARVAVRIPTRPLERHPATGPD